MYSELKDHIERRKYWLDGEDGEWLNINKGYETYICAKLDLNLDDTRYWDATWEDYFLEFKKGKSIWFNLVIYSEIQLKVNDDAQKETLTLFFIPNNGKKHIEKIICLETGRLIRKFQLDDDLAKTILSLNERVPRSLNAQANLTVRDVEEMSNFIVEVRYY